jgi:hypothetical protein
VTTGSKVICVEKLANVKQPPIKKEEGDDDDTAKVKVEGDDEDAKVKIEN